MKRIGYKRYIIIYMMIMCCVIGIAHRGLIEKAFDGEENLLQDIDLYRDDTYQVNNVMIQDKTLVVTGADPYVVIDDVSGFVENIEIELSAGDCSEAAIAIYYDKGNGFNKDDKSSISLSDEKAYVIEVQEKVSKVRLDFEGEMNDIRVKKCTIHYGQPQVMEKIAMCLIFYLLVDVMVAFIILKVLKVTLHWWKSANLCFQFVLLIGYVIIKGLCSVCYVGDADISVKMVMFACNILLVSAAICKLESEDRYASVLFLMGIGMYYFSWALVIPFNQAPDEEMRYLVPQYIYRHGCLPRGEDPEIMNDVWGFSYGFTPGLSYIFSAICMKICSVVSTTERALLTAARMPAVLFSVGTVGISSRIGKKLFASEISWMLPVLIAFLPQFSFVSSYVNCDAIALFAIAWIIYALLVGKEDNWSLKHCILLGIGIGICLLSYYNAYGIVVVAMIYAIVDVLRNSEIEYKGKFLFTRILWVAIPALIVAGWWFIRNYVLYQDILGFKSTSMYGEMYAVEELKPSNRTTPFKQGVSLIDMLVGMGWLTNSWHSFIGRFGYMDLPVKNYQFLIMSLILMAGMLLFTLFCVKKRKLGLFDGLMILMCVITICLSIYYSYFNDYQPQGRYCLSMWISLAYLVTKGYSKVINDKRKGIITIGVGVYCLISVDVLINVVMNHYIL